MYTCMYCNSNVLLQKETQYSFSVTLLATCRQPTSTLRELHEYLRYITIAPHIQHASAQIIGKYHTPA